MDLREIVSGLDCFPNREVAWYDRDDRSCRRSFAGLREDVEAAAARLAALGVEPGMRIGLMAQNCYEWVVFDLALLHMRCPSVALPLELARDPIEAPAGRLDLRLVLVSARDVPPAWSGAPFVATFEGVLDDAAREHPPRLRPGGVHGPDLEFSELGLIFSSGSTGRLKCMRVNRRGAEQMRDRFGAGFGLSDRDAWMVFLPFSNYQQRVMVYGAVRFGMELQIADPGLLMRALGELRPTCLVAPPLFFESIETRLCRRPDAERAVRELLGGRTRLLVTGSAPIRRSALEAFDRIGLPIYETYGLTESGPITCNVPGARRLGSVGRVVGEGEVSLADDGEIIVTREHPLTSGYLDPQDEEETRTYRSPSTIATGDVGRFDDDGYLYLLGRKKEMIVTAGGYKLHPEEIESRLSSGPHVLRSVVFGGAGLPTLAAVIALEDSAGAEAESDVRRFVSALNRELPTPRQIGRLVFTRAPFTAESGLLTRNLKVDRGEVFRRFEPKLKEAEPPRDGAPDTEALTPEPLTPEQQELAEIFTEILSVDRVGPDDDFFALGGDSILVAQLVQRVRERGRSITAAHVMEHPTVRELAAAEVDLPLRVDQGAVAGEIRITPPQAYLLAGAQGRPGGFCTTLLLVAREPLIAPLLERALESVTRHHDALRLRFEPGADGWRATCDPPEGVNVPVTRLDAAGLAPGAFHRLVLEGVERARGRIDPAEGRPMSVELIDGGPGKPSHLLLGVHFLSVDGYSWPILIADLERAYRRVAEGGAIQLPPKTTSYRDWAIRQEELADSPEVLRDLDFWLAQGVDPPDPALRPLGVSDGAAERVEGVELLFEAAETRALLAAAMERRAPLDQLLVGALAHALHAGFGAQRVALGLRSHGRRADPGLDVSRTVGCFVSVYPVVVALGEAPSPEDALAAVRDRLAAVPASGRSYGILRLHARDPRAETLRAQPLPQIGFNHRGRFVTRYGSFSLGSLQGRPGMFERVPHRHAIEVGSTVIGDQLVVRFEYAAGRCERGAIEALAGRFRAALQALAP